MTNNQLPITNYKCLINPGVNLKTNRMLSKKVVRRRTARGGKLKGATEAAQNVRKRTSPSKMKAMQDHIRARAGTWDGIWSGEELLRKTRP
jgi:hypothetical protein